MRGWLSLTPFFPTPFPRFTSDQQEPMRVPFQDVVIVITWPLKFMIICMLPVAESPLRGTRLKIERRKDMKRLYSQLDEFEEFGDRVDW